MTADAPLLRAEGLVKRYPVRGGSQELTALAGVSFELRPRETLGVLGESGCGKSTLAKLLVQLEAPTSGTVTLDGRVLTGLRGSALRVARRDIQMVFQDPYSSLNPRRRIGEVLGDVLDVHRLVSSRTARTARVHELLDLVGLGPQLATSLPHELSGGQRQRVGIARALAVEPRVLVLDEPVSALDVSVRAEIMNLLARLRDELGLSYLFISHDVSMVRHLADRVLVMYLGRVVEAGPWQLVDSPLHPYAAGLADAVPVPDPELAQPITATVRGEVPDPVNPPSGCAFHPRCPVAEAVCREVRPDLLEARPAHEVACHVVNRPST